VTWIASVIPDAAMLAAKSITASVGDAAPARDALDDVAAFVIVTAQ
jgi:hypothetical protein